MNIIIDIVLVVIFTMTVISFYRKGFIKALFSLCKVFVSTIAAFVLTPLVINIISNKLLAFIIIFVLSMIACGLLSYVMDTLFKLPVLKEINKLFGLALGAVCGFLYMLVSFSIITLILDLVGVNNPELSVEVMTEKTLVYSFLSRIDIVSFLFLY